MSLETWVLDFETYFDGDYSLSKMTTEAYVRDWRFEPLMLGYRDPTGQRGWVGQEDISYFLRQINWDVSAILAHHAHFDGLIFSHHYGVKPAMWFDTLSMARQCHNNEKMSVSLDSLAKFYGLEAKKVPYDQFKGKRWYQIDPALRRLLGEGAEHDCGLTFDIFAQMARTFSAELYPLVDITVRMFTEPAFEGDAELFDKISGEEMRRKYEILNRLQVTEKDLASNDKFTAILEGMGVEIEYKTGTKGLIPAIAATDDFLRALIDDPDEELSTLAQARVDVKSTIAQTRSARLADMSRRGPLCVYLNFAGAQNTLRWSGGDKLNFQNFPRIDRVEKKIENPLQLRLGIKAPQGKVIAIADQSQIECRLLNRVAGQWDMVERFKLKQDPYVGVASKFYGREITKADEKERGTGKQLELSCGYGAGDKTIQDTAKKGTYGPPVFMTIEEAALAKSIYRDSHQAVVDLWREGDRVLHALAHKGTMIWRDVVEIKDGKIYGPNGSWLTYNLTWDDGWRAWMRHTRKGRKKIWGGHLVENLIQWLAWITMGQAIVRIQKTTGFRPATSSHDEGVWLLNDDPNAQLYLEYFLGEMRRCPTWLPDTPLDAEGKLSYVYDK